MYTRTPSSTEHTSPAFTQFLEFLGERIELNGWTGYRAGLDVSQDLTGTHSYYTKWQSHEIMFHVATCLPFTPRVVFVVVATQVMVDVHL